MQGLRVLTCSVLLVLIGCSEPEKPQTVVRAVRTMVVGSSPTVVSSTLAGEVRSRNETALGFRVSGKLVRRLVDVGAEVKAGQVLAEMDAADFKLGVDGIEAQLLGTEAQLRVAQQDFERVQQLQAKGYASKAELDRFEGQWELAKAQDAALRSQAKQLRNQSVYTVLRADANGVVSAVLAEAGQVLGAGQAVVKIARTDALEVVVGVPETQLAGLAIGMPANLTLWVAGDKPFAGVVREIAAAADPATRTYNVRISVASPPPAMRMGMTATATFVARDLPQTLQVPSAAVVAHAGKSGVWIVQGEPLKAQFAPIVFGGAQGNDVIIVNGLKAGQRVITAGASYIVDGQIVKLLAAVP